MTSSTHLNSHFFNSSYKHAWKALMPQGLTDAEADFISEFSGKDGNVLDLMCGHGRHAIALAKKGIKVTAIDNLQDYVDEINSFSEQQSLPVKAVQAHILDVNLNELYEVAICMGNSFAFFNKDEATGLLKKISAHLKPGGIFIINSWMIAEIAIKHFKEKDWHYAGDYKCVLEYTYCFHPARIESEQTIISKDGKVEILKGVDYIFTLDEMDDMFRQAGLRTKALYSTPRKKKFSVGDGQIYIVAERL